MHVVIGSTGMQQGLASYQHRKLLRVLVIFNSSEVPELLVLFYEHRKLLRVLIIFNSSEVPELLVLYAPHIHIQAYNGNK
jgi:hypothetical protein